MPDDDRDTAAAVIQQIIDEFSRMLGEKVALMLARKAPIEIDESGTVTTFYGKDEQAIQILIAQYENYVGDGIADSRIRSAFIDQPDQQDLLPDRLYDEDATGAGGDSLVERLKELFHGSAAAQTL